MLTTKGLVKHCERALNEKWGYVWGTFGFVLTEEVLKYKLRQYPNEVGTKLKIIRSKWVNKRTTDCVGLIKSYLWWDEKLDDPIYNTNTDVSADHMFMFSKNKAPIDHNRLMTDLNIPGLCLWKHGHIGVYIGNGKVIEAHSTDTGVILTDLKGPNATPWTHWLECPYIDLIERELKKDEDVLKLQEDLNKLGYRLEVDGLLGPLTIAAIRHFQANNNLEIDGIAGPKTKKALSDILLKLYNPKKDYTEIIKEISNGSADQWVKAIKIASELAASDSNLGDLEIFQHLPLLIQKIYYKK